MKKEQNTTKSSDALDKGMVGAKIEEFILKHERLLQGQFQDWAQSLQLGKGQQILIEGRIEHTGVHVAIRFQDQFRRQRSRAIDRLLSSDELKKIASFKKYLGSRPRHLVQLFIDSGNQPLERQVLLIDMGYNSGHIDQINRVLREKGLQFGLRAITDRPCWEQLFCFRPIQEWSQ